MKQPTVAIVTTRSTALCRTTTTTLASPMPPFRVLSAVVSIVLLAGVASGSDDTALRTEEPNTRRFVIESVADPLGADEALALAKLLAHREPNDALILGGLPKRVLRNLQFAYPLALQRVREVESCKGLFAELSADGVKMLSTSIYRPATSSREMKACNSRSAVAFTTIGRPHTRVCWGFARLPRTEAAMILIHEGLHHAGMSEKPFDPDALGSVQINRLVRKSCNL